MEHRVNCKICVILELYSELIQQMLYFNWGNIKGVVFRIFN